MIRLGVTCREGLSRPKTLIGLQKDIAASVLMAAWQDPSGTYDDVCRQAFHRLKMSNGVVKTSAPGRFDDVDDKLLNIIDKELRGLCSLAVHDLGVSDGTTAVEWFGRLDTLAPEIVFTLSDYYDRCYVVQCEGSRWTAVLDAELLPMQFFRGPLVLTPHQSALYYPVNWVTWRLVARLLSPALQRLRRQWGPGLPVPRGFAVDDYLLLGPEALKLVADNERVRFVRHDVMKPLDREYSLIRVMNLLNLGYFPSERLLGALQMIRNSLADGGLLIIGRSMARPNGGWTTACSVFKATTTGAEELASFNGGSEVSEFVRRAFQST